MKQPVARVEVVRDTYFGTTIEDPYRWMEDWKSPVLLRVDFQAGHGMGSTRQQVYEERADAFAFVLQQCGKLRS